jgi:hypothetical protein
LALASVAEPQSFELSSEVSYESFNADEPTAQELALRWSTGSAAAMALAMAVFFTQLAGRAAPKPPPTAAVSLPFSEEFTLTGNVTVGSVDVEPTGRATSRKRSSTSTTSGECRRFAGRNHRRLAVLRTNRTLQSGYRWRRVQWPSIKVAKVAPDDNGFTLDGPFASCWGGGGSGLVYKMFQSRADVRRMLPLLKDASDKSTGIRLVNDADLQKIRLLRPQRPEQAVRPQGTAAEPNRESVHRHRRRSLVVVFREPREPLRRIVVHDGIQVLRNAPDARFGAANPRDLSVDCRSEGATHPDRRKRPAEWIGPHISDNHVLQRLARRNRRISGTSKHPTGRGRPCGFPWHAHEQQWHSGDAGYFANDGFGETVATKVDHANGSPYDCISWGAVILATAVKNIDGDSAPDGMETGTVDRMALTQSPTSERPAAPQPLGHGDVAALGGSSRHRDVYLQVDAMRTTGDNDLRQYEPRAVSGVSSGQLTLPAHTHVPSPAALKIFINTYRQAPLKNDFLLNGVSQGDDTFGVWPHIDVGDTTAYKNLFVDPNDPNDPDLADFNAIKPYLVLQHTQERARHRRDQMRVGRQPAEDPGAASCQFYYFPGAVGWQRGDRAYSAAYGLSIAERNGVFLEAFFVHSSGTPRSQDITKTDFRVPRTVTGHSQQPGQRLQISTGTVGPRQGRRVPEHVGGTLFTKPDTPADLWHGGPRPKITIETTASPTRSSGCRTELQSLNTSVMSYAFQVVGQRDDSGNRYFDYSRGGYAAVTLATRPI